MSESNSPVQACDECQRLTEERERAQRVYDYSKVTDCNVLLARHQRSSGHGAAG
ncbi:hypothetical protein [Streptomyces xinghaiensis]|uniref:hypothetical protein n=1 Tax=Streptomyces xinghaiensis TaxID=1038928 RepID=UPI002E136FE5|nr:hypothetical protein OG463_07740 [Streptomyces xinghaiensis]